MNPLEDWKRVIETELSDAGFTECVVETKLDGENKVVVAITHQGRTADGLPRLVMDAIADAKQNGISLTEAFDVRNMYAPAI